MPKTIDRSKERSDIQRIVAKHIVGGNPRKKRPIPDGECVGSTPLQSVVRLGPPVRQPTRINPNYETPAGSAWLRENWDTIPDNHWVAAGPNGIVVLDPTQDGFFAKLKACGSPKGTILAFKSRHPIRCF